MQRLSVWCALRCREPEFQRFLGVTNEQAAADKVRSVCGIESRAELDADAEAAQRLHDRIRKPFIEFNEREREEAFQQ
jgi:hypothetical protein